MARQRRSFHAIIRPIPRAASPVMPTISVIWSWRAIVALRMHASPSGRRICAGPAPRGFAMDAVTRPKRKASTASRPYPDLHDHVAALDAAGLLIKVDRPINKDTEMHPLVRWQFRGGIAEKDRRAFLFTNVVDAKGRAYDIPVLVGGLAANREIYRIGLGCPFEEIDARWVRAIANPIPPRIVDRAPCHDVVITGM